MRSIRNAVTAVGALALLTAAPLATAGRDTRAPEAEQEASRAPGFVRLFDGTLNGWTVENSTANNFSVQDGILRVQGPSGWLRSAREYRDFVLRAEFRFVTPDADSGIFVRAVGSAIFMRGWPGDSYQVQVRVPTAPGPLPPVGGIFRHGTPPGTTTLDVAAVKSAFTGVGEWHRLEIEVSGTSLVASLNGTATTRAEVVSRAGYVGVQGETGVVEYRSIEIGER